MTAAPPKECPTSNRTSWPESFMNCTARTVSSTLWENDPSPQSPSESPRPRLSKRSMPMPSAASCLQIRLAARLSLPSVKPCAKTPQPRTSCSGGSTRPARLGPVLLRKLTRSATLSRCWCPIGGCHELLFGATGAAVAELDLDLAGGGQGGQIALSCRPGHADRGRDLGGRHRLSGRLKSLQHKLFGGRCGVRRRLLDRHAGTERVQGGVHVVRAEIGTRQNAAVAAVA